MVTDTEKTEIAGIYLSLQEELDNTSNLNWVCFKEYREAQKTKIEKLKKFLEHWRVEPKTWGDDADEAFSLINTMLDGNPDELPCSDDGRYAALRRILMGLGVINENKETQELELRTVPVVSTAHMTREDDELLSRAGTHGHIDGALRFGYMLRVSIDRGDWHGDMSEGFMGLMRFIHARGFEWIILDCDGSVISALPTYEW